MSPYPFDFVPIDFGKAPERHRPLGHDKLQGITGELTAAITAETPLFIPKHRARAPKAFIQDRRGRHIIPGSSLKGLFRSLVETVANGCFSQFAGEYKDKDRGPSNRSSGLPDAFRKCRDSGRLCISCRTFGMVGDGEARFSGKVCLGDAVSENAREDEKGFAPNLMGPKPHHTAFYMSGSLIAGRKFYLHHEPLPPPKGTAAGSDRKIKPIAKGARFSFTMAFANLEEGEWQALLYAIVLEPQMRHKLGYAKPSGLGSVHCEVTHIKLLDCRARYLSPAGGMTDYQGKALVDYLSVQIARYVTDTRSSTLTALRRIWRWPPAPGAIAYPGQAWFSDHPNDPISKVP